MLAFAALCFSLLFSVVLSIPLAQRDVFNPHITNPREGTVWTVGAKETVTWRTDDIPPDSQLTNPIGRVILGFLENDSLNLQLDHPLAEGFSIRDGQVTITVPDVPPRNDYIVVLMGDSGNASPAFAITSIAGGSSSKSSPTGSSTTSSFTSTSSTPSSTVDNSPPFTGSSITHGSASTSSSASSSNSDAPEPTPTASASSVDVSVPASSAPSTSPASVTLTQAVTAAAASTSSSANAAWSRHNAKLWSVIAAPLALSLLL